MEITSRFEIEGCPLVACPRCQRWFKGWTPQALGKALLNNQLPENLCEPIQARVDAAKENWGLQNEGGENGKERRTCSWVLSNE